jgi:hypothetical protein
VPPSLRVARREGRTLSFTAIIPGSRRCNKLGAMLIYLMSVSVDGFIADREGRVWVDGP